MKKIILCTIFVTIFTLIQGGEVMAFTITSSAFQNESTIPSKYTCDGADISPSLSWQGAPSGTKGFALIADDPDAPVCTWVHWVVWNIPATATSLKEAIDKSASLSDGTKQGISDFKCTGYGGPCPPSGTHRYFFKLYALDTTLSLPENTTKATLEEAIKGHVLAQTNLMGIYSRAR